MKYLIILVALLLGQNIQSQELSGKETAKFLAAESQLKQYTDLFNLDSLSFEERVTAIHEFIPRFVAILKEKNSFLHPFDSLVTIAKVQPEDNAFRIFTWQLKEPLGTYKYYGAIQMNTKDLQMVPLFDYSDTMMVYPQEVLTAENWYGGIYYDCILKEYKGQKTYTLLGMDDVDFVSRIKFMETISFDENNKPSFGSPIIEFYDSLGVYIKTKTRFFNEYDDKASARLSYDPVLDKIIFDHVVPPGELQQDAEFTYIPDGTYEGFEWKNGKWKWVEKMFHYSIGKPDSPPMPAPILDKGKKNIIGG